LNVRTHRTKFLAGIAASCLALTSIGPSFAQSGPTLGSWLAGPDGKGSSTIVGRVDSPRPRASVNPGSNLLVSGWAADTTAAGWAGIDGVEVWSGSSDKSGSTKISKGLAGLARADVGEALGGSFTNSGFSAIVPASALQGMTGAQTLYVYLHTPGKGTWYRTVGVSLVSATAVNLATGGPLAFPTDPMVVIARPQDGTAITQLQRNNKFTFSGIALDRNPITDPKIQLTGPGCNACAGATGSIGTSARGSGISSVTAYLDKPPVKGDNTSFGGFGIGAGAGAGLYANILVSSLGALNRPGVPNGSIITRQYGSQFDYSGWTIAINPATLTPGSHTLYVTATSSVTGYLDQTNKFVGKTSTASVTFDVLDFSHKKIQPDPLLCKGIPC